MDKELSTKALWIMMLCLINLTKAEQYNQVFFILLYRSIQNIMYQKIDLDEDFETDKINVR